MMYEHAERQAPGDEPKEAMIISSDPTTHPERIREAPPQLGAAAAADAR